ncbi:MAG: hypothetical protein E7332_06180 [Clostridiales bacterium]|nr:hypothetical protein [Clostridiales bacterium]
MEKVRAFYYKGHYYLYPKKYPDYNSFLVYLAENKAVNVTELRFHKCLPPYFAEDGMTKTDIFIENENDIIDRDVFLLSRAEYDERLREKVCAICPGCLRYGGDAEDLTGHHEEMTLDGKCFFRVTKETEGYVYYSGVMLFWHEFMQNEKHLRKLVLQGRHIEAEEEITAIASNTLPNSVFTLYKTGRSLFAPVLMMSAQGSDDFGFLNEFVILHAPEKIKKRWKLLPYLHKRYYKYKPAFYNGEYLDDLREKGIGVAFEPVDADRPRFKIKLYIPQTETDGQRPEHNGYLYLCSLIGENRLIAACAGLDIIRDENPEQYGKPSALADAIQSAYLSPLFAPYLRQYNANDIVLMERPPLEYLGEEMSARTKSLHLMLEVSERAEARDFILDFTDQLRLPLGKIVLNIPQEENGRQHIDDLMKNYFLPMEEKGAIAIFGVAMGKREFGLFFVVCDKDLFHKEYYLIEPEMLRSSAKLSIDMAKELSEIAVEEEINP